MHSPYNDREWLRSRYEDRGMALRRIAAEAGVALRTIARWMATHGIQTRDNTTAIRLIDRAGQANPRWKGGPICPDCGGRRGYGARRCKACWTAIKQGAGNPNWRGGITAETVRLRASPEYAAWREAVFARDGYACCACGDSRGRNLQAHHRQSWAEHAAGRFDPENGTTLCERCHRAAHAQPYRPGTATRPGIRALSPTERIVIRLAYRAGGITQKRLASRYGVNQATISRLVRA